MRDTELPQRRLQLYVVSALHVLLLPCLPSSDLGVVHTPSLQSQTAMRSNA